MDRKCVDAEGTTLMACQIWYCKQVIKCILWNQLIICYIHWLIL